MNRLFALINRPPRGFTPLAAARHGLTAAALAAMAMSMEMTKLGIPAAPFKRPQSVQQPAEPVVLHKNGFVIYDSGRAEAVAAIWNVTDLAKAEAVLALLDRKRFLESRR